MIHSVTDQSHAKSQGQSRVVCIFAVIRLAVAINVGLGAGLTVEHRSSSSR